MQRLEKIFEPRFEVKVLIKKFLIVVTDVVVVVVTVVVVVVVGVTVARMPTLWMTWTSKCRRYATFRESFHFATLKLYLDWVKLGVSFINFVEL